MNTFKASNFAANKGSSEDVTRMKTECTKST